jgi:UDP:flavonoid glycosyltransferase YjiC (YdhE family)
VLIAGTVTVRSVGAPALPSVLGALAITGAVCLLTLAHAQRLGVSVTQPQRLLRWRMLPHALVLALAAGVLHPGGEAGFGQCPADSRWVSLSVSRWVSVSLSLWRESC